MPSIGFDPCPVYGRARFEACLTCPNRCLPLPVLMAESENRDIVEGEFSTTENTGNTLRQAYLKRHFDYYISPMDSIFLVNGTAVHEIFERGANMIDRIGAKIKGFITGKHVSEQGFRVEILPGYYLTGKPDYYDGESKTLWDWKNSKKLNIMDVKRDAVNKLPWLANDKFMQLNVYRTFHFREAVSLKNAFMYQGWEAKVQEKGKWIPNPLSQIEVVDAPVAPHAEVELWIKNRFQKIREMEETGVVLNVPRAITRSMASCRTGLRRSDAPDTARGEKTATNLLK